MQEETDAFCAFFAFFSVENHRVFPGNRASATAFALHRLPDLQCKREQLQNKGIKQRSETIEKQGGFAFRNHPVDLFLE